MADCPPRVAGNSTILKEVHRSLSMNGDGNAFPVTSDYVGVLSWCRENAAGNMLKNVVVDGNGVCK
jgi:hypothetical protein